MKNKKLTTLSFVLGLSGITFIGGITAYFTDADTVTNEFSIGKISLDLQEPNWVPPTNITPNQVIKKDPQIKNDGINDEFVFLEVKVPVKNIVTAELDGTKKPAIDTELFTYEINENWIQVDNDIKSSNSITRIYAYAKDNQCIPLKKDEITTPLFNTVKFCNATEDQGLELTTEQIVINAYGIQTNDINNIDGINKTSPHDVWEIISNQKNLQPSIEKTSKLMNGESFQEKFDKSFSTATSVDFVKRKAIPENVMIVDFSENQDGSILAWQEDGKVYINSNDKIMANENCSYMFAYSKLEYINFYNFDTSNVTDMSHMFRGNNNLKKLDLSSFTTSNVTTMKSMFWSCDNLLELDVTSFDTKNVTDMEFMFYLCNKLVELDISNFNTSNVINVSNMFGMCRKLERLNLGNFDISNVKYISYIFSQCNSLTELNLSSFGESKVKNINGLFMECTNLKKLDIHNLDTKNVNSLYQLFDSCNELTELDLSNFDISNVTNIEYMFAYTPKLKTVYVKKQEDIKFYKEDEANEHINFIVK